MMKREEAPAAGASESAVRRDASQRQKSWLRRNQAKKCENKRRLSVSEKRSAMSEGGTNEIADDIRAIAPPLGRWHRHHHRQQHHALGPGRTTVLFLALWQFSLSVRRQISWCDTLLWCLPSRRIYGCDIEPLSPVPCRSYFFVRVCVSLCAFTSVLTLGILSSLLFLRG